MKQLSHYPFPIPARYASRSLATSSSGPISKIWIRYIPKRNSWKNQLSPYWLNDTNNCKRYREKTNRGSTLIKIFLLHIVDKAVESIWCKQLQIEPKWKPIFSLLCTQPMNNAWLVQLCLILATSITRYWKSINQQYIKTAVNKKKNNNNTTNDNDHNDD